MMAMFGYRFRTEPKASVKLTLADCKNTSIGRVGFSFAVDSIAHSCRKLNESLPDVSWKYILSDLFLNSFGSACDDEDLCQWIILLFSFKQQNSDLF